MKESNVPLMFIDWEVLSFCIYTLLLSRLQVIEDMILYYTYWSCRLGHGFSVLLFSVDLIHHEWAICRERCCHWQHLIHFVIQLLLGLAFQPFVAFLYRP